MLSCNSILGAVVLLSLGLLASAQCPLRCQCRIVGNKHNVDCYERNLEVPPNFGSDMYETMNFGRNKLKKLPSYAFEKFPGLTHLNLSYNFIVELEESSFKGLSSLTVLDLSNNSIVYIRPYFLTPCPGIMWLSLARNEYIGKEITSLVAHQKNATWLVAPSLRTLVLSTCNLEFFPPWMVAGLPGLETLDVSNNRIKVLPVLSVVSVCRVRMMDLSRNPFNCEGICENAVTKKYLADNKQITLAGNATFCIRARNGCNVNITEDEEAVRQNCLLQEIPKPLERRQPRSVWLYIGAASGGLVGLLFLALLFNGIVSSFRRSESPPPTPHSSPHSRAVQQELKEILSRPESVYKDDDSESEH
ncbi:chondroadherin-like protein isoform X2 [Neocloeon triangulifer]|uniref:chondroadherin-like protein isoform X2 n=1 Tax=Neocloeon triangulifer TaxID=2078957 RepID=UPI00286F3D8A|nr:chondroadherin-like protein isoform X2 [Neocloeon triangulifer]